MAIVHIFVSTARFQSFAQVREFTDESYTEDGDSIPSVLAREILLHNYEPACIEAMHSDHAVPLGDLLANASYANQWLPDLDSSILADVAICVFSPNEVLDPHGSSLRYIGSFGYAPPNNSCMDSSCK